MEKVPKQDQAETLRTYKREGGFEEDISVLDLPPRSEVHQSKPKKTKWKLNILWLRFLFILLIIIISVFLSYPYWGEWFERSDPMMIMDEKPLHEEVTVETE